MQVARPGIARAVADGRTRTFPGSGAMRPVTKGGALWVEVGDSGSSVERHRIVYFLGRGVIEQHLTPFPGGRLQALPFGFDLGKPSGSTSSRARRVRQETGATGRTPE